VIISHGANNSQASPNTGWHRKRVPTRSDQYLECEYKGNSATGLHCSPKAIFAKETCGSCLSLYELQLFFHMCSTDLGVTYSCLDGRCTFHRHMPKIVRNLFECPASGSGTVGKIMPKIMKGEIGNQVPLLFGGVLFHLTKPMVNALYWLLSISVPKKERSCWL